MCFPLWLAFAVCLNTLLLSLLWPFWNDQRPRVQHACGMKNIYYCNTVFFTLGFLLWKPQQLTQYSDYAIIQTTTEMRFNSSKGQEIFLYSNVSRLALVPTQSSGHCGLFSRKQSSQGMKLTIYWQLVQKLRNCAACISILDMVLNEIHSHHLLYLWNFF